ncbi:hypothetical protein IDJ77_04130 [Mucilaginibacter sp. ZT4R22]|uniref:Uncharacterized protein n=1 Tax=Mucilaginibacter pankratovii TaxID=2772110 RepID=A0ABR7WL10_9SPHI|nr:hypothetical protein [Mucilaginibacter pankratovii]MBD1362990.1 hypothetical protein [Mucilaginibacter pankratovii]
MKNLICNHIEILLSVVGIYLRFLIGKRRFNRRGVGGLQYFKSYSIALITAFVEKSVNIIAMLMIITAIILLLRR